MSQLAFYFDAASCSGCKTCQVACKDKHNLPMGIRWRRVYEICGGDWKQEGKIWMQNIHSFHVSLACNHCREPICLEVCPNRAITKNSRGIVEIDPLRCMGCRYCEMSCPYGALQYDKESRLMTKGNLCLDYLEMGQLPSCVAACPMRALDIGELEELRAKYPDAIDNIFPLPASHHTLPSVLVKAHPHALTKEGPGLQINNTEEVR